MNDIQVGDRVHPDGYGDNVTLRVVAIEGNEAWLVDFMGVHRTHRLAALTRISPEKVVLTPKYVVGQRVRSTLTDTIYTIEALGRTTYRTTTGCTVDESNLEPVPEPCPECKGSGVASE